MADERDESGEGFGPNLRLTGHIRAVAGRVGQTILKMAMPLVAMPLVAALMIGGHVAASQWTMTPWRSPFLENRWNQFPDPFVWVTLALVAWGSTISSGTMGPKRWVSWAFVPGVGLCGWLLWRLVHELCGTEDRTFWVRAACFCIAAGLSLALRSFSSPREPDTDWWTRLLVGVFLLVVARSSLLLDGLYQHTPTTLNYPCLLDWSDWRELQVELLLAGGVAAAAAITLVAAMTRRLTVDAKVDTTLLALPLAVVLVATALRDGLSGLTLLPGGLATPSSSAEALPADWLSWVGTTMEWGLTVVWIVVGGVVGWALFKGLTRAPAESAQWRRALPVFIVAAASAVLLMRATHWRQSRVAEVDGLVSVFSLAAPPGATDRVRACEEHLEFLARAAEAEDDSGPPLGYVFVSPPRPDAWLASATMRPLRDGGFAFAVTTVLGVLLWRWRRRREPVGGDGGPYREPGIEVSVGELRSALGLAISRILWSATLTVFLVMATVALVSNCYGLR